MFIMKLLFCVLVTLTLTAESKSSPLGQDGKKEDMLVQCLMEVLTKVVSKPGGMSLQPECKDILQIQGSRHTLLTKTNEDEMIPIEKNEKSPERQSNAKVQKIIDELLKTNKERHVDMDEERSQEEFPNYHKRHDIMASKEKREDPDDERSQEEFPQKRYSLLSKKEKREYQDDERSQEEFPNYERKRRLFLKEKRDDPDYDRSQEEFPSYVYKRYDEDRGAERQIWKPQNYYKQYDEDFARANSQELEDGLEESEEKEKRLWKPSFRSYNIKHFYKQGTFENDANPHLLLENSKHHSPEKEREELVANQEEPKRDYGDAEERDQEEEAALRYLTERLQENGEVFNKHNPQIYKESHHPAWYRQSAQGQNMEHLAHVLRSKLGLLSEKEATEGEKAYLHQRALTPEELKELEKITSVEQQAQMN